MQPKPRRRHAASPVGWGAALPLRTIPRAWNDARIAGRSIDRAVRGSKTHNFCYFSCDLEDRRLHQLCLFVPAITGAEIRQVRAWTQELDKDEDLTGELTSDSVRGISATGPHWDAIRRNSEVGMRLQTTEVHDPVGAFAR
jgi:hypothetical protein